MRREIVLEVFHHLKLDIAVTGESGTGKSSLVNALLGLNHDEGAPTGMEETTMKPTMYQHPKHPLLRVWDLPGIDNSSLNSRSYIKKMDFDRYDMFIVVDSTRVKENSLYIVDEILKRHRPFYFVRTRIDDDIASESKKHGFVETDVMEVIRKDCVDHLQTKIEQPLVFLVSTHGTEEYDLQHLMQTLEGDLPLLRKTAFGVFLKTSFHKIYMLFECIDPPALIRNKCSRDDLEKMRQVIKCSKTLLTQDVKTTREDIISIIDAVEQGSPTLCPRAPGSPQGPHE